MKLSELQALIKLLDDPDEFIIKNVEQKLNTYLDSLSSAYLPSLLNFASSDLAKKRLLDIIYNHNFKLVKNNLFNWVEKPTQLSQALFLISKLFDPLLDYTQFISKIFSLHRHFPADFPDNYSPLEQAKYILRVFFKIENFSWHFDQDHFEFIIPYQVLLSHKGDYFALANILAALAQSFGLNWFCFFDSETSNIFVAAPANKKFIIISPKLKTTLPYYHNLQDQAAKLYNSLKNNLNLQCIQLLIQKLTSSPKILPRKFDEQWYILSKTLFAISVKLKNLLNE